MPWFLAGIATTRQFRFPDRENAGLTPASFKLASEDVSFRSADGVELRGWWVPAAEPRGSVVMVHGLNRSRIEMIRRVPFVHEAGWNALVFDLRHHGESGGRATTFGAKEKQDVEAAAQLARSRTPGPVVLWGVSLGAASAMLAAADDPAIAGVDLRQQLPLARRHRAPPRRARPAAGAGGSRSCRRGPSPTRCSSGWDGAAPSTPRRSTCERRRRAWPAGPPCSSPTPTTARMPKEIAFDLKAAAGKDAEVLIVPGKSHGGAWRDGTAAYQAAAQVVLDRAASSAAGPPGEPVRVRGRGPTTEKVRRTREGGP